MNTRLRDMAALLDQTLTDWRVRTDHEVTKGSGAMSTWIHTFPERMGVITPTDRQTYIQTDRETDGGKEGQRGEEECLEREQMSRVVAPFSPSECSTSSDSVRERNEQ
jgi:hypothetical protein